MANYSEFLPKNRPYQGIEVVLSSPTGKRVDVTESTETGYFEFINILPGPYRLDFYGGGYTKEDSRLIFVVQGEDDLDFYYILADPKPIIVEPDDLITIQLYRISQGQMTEVSSGEVKLYYFDGFAYQPLSNLTDSPDFIPGDYSAQLTSTQVAPQLIVYPVKNANFPNQRVYPPLTLYDLEKSDATVQFIVLPQDRVFKPVPGVDYSLDPAEGYDPGEISIRPQVTYKGEVLDGFDSRLEFFEPAIINSGVGVDFNLSTGECIVDTPEFFKQPAAPQFFNIVLSGTITPDPLLPDDKVAFVGSVVVPLLDRPPGSTAVTIFPPIVQLKQLNDGTIEHDFPVDGLSIKGRILEGNLDITSQYWISEFTILDRTGETVLSNSILDNPSTPPQAAGNVTFKVYDVVDPPSDGVVLNLVFKNLINPSKPDLTGTCFFTIQPIGRTGAGLLYIGNFDDLAATRPLHNNDYARDVVSHLDSFWLYSGPNLQQKQDTDVPGTLESPDWIEFEQFDAVAIRFLLTEMSYVKTTINIGTDDSSTAPRISIHGGDQYPYISIGQQTPGFVQPLSDWEGNPQSSRAGIFLGIGEFSSAPTRRPVLSLYNAQLNKGLFWDGDELYIRGAIRQTPGGEQSQYTDFRLMDKWAPGVSYIQNDLVQYDSGLGIELWKATSSHNPSTDDLDPETGRPGAGPWALYSGVLGSSEVLKLTASQLYFVKSSVNTTLVSPNWITIQAKRPSLGGEISWTSPVPLWADQGGTIPATTESLVYILKDQAQVQLVQNNQPLVVTAKVADQQDSVTIKRVDNSGTNFTSILSNPRHIFPVTFDGKVPESAYASGDIETYAFLGSQQLTLKATSDVPAVGSGQYQATIVGTGISFSAYTKQLSPTLSIRVFRPIAITAPSGQATITFTWPGGTQTTELFYFTTTGATNPGSQAQVMVMQSSSPFGFVRDLRNYADNIMTPESVIFTLQTTNIASELPAEWAITSTNPTATIAPTSTTSRSMTISWEDIAEQLDIWPYNESNQQIPDITVSASLAGKLVSQKLDWIPTTFEGEIAVRMTNLTPQIRAKWDGEVYPGGYDQTGTLFELIYGLVSLKAVNKTPETLLDYEYCLVSSTGVNITPGATTIITPYPGGQLALQIGDHSNMVLNEKQARVDYVIAYKLPFRDVVEISRSQVITKVFDPRAVKAVTIDNPYPQVLRYPQPGNMEGTTFEIIIKPPTVDITANILETAIDSLPDLEVSWQVTGATYEIDVEDANKITVDVEGAFEDLPGGGHEITITASYGSVFATSKITLIDQTNVGQQLFAVLDKSATPLPASPTGVVTDYSLSQVKMWVTYGGYPLKYVTGTTPTQLSTFTLASEVVSGSAILGNSIDIDPFDESIDIGPITSLTTDTATIKYTIKAKVEVDGSITEFVTYFRVAKNYTVQGPQGNIGPAGPGLVYRGAFSTANLYWYNSSRRDLVISGGQYWAVNVASAGQTGSSLGTPSAGNTNWLLFNNFQAVATNLLFAGDAYINRTLNLGAEGPSPVISLIPDYPNYYNPYIKIGSNITGYNTGPGIFMGITERVSTAGAGVPKLSILNTGGTRGLLWDGENLYVRGGIIQNEGGTVTYDQYRSRGLWAAATPYLKGDLVQYDRGAGVETWACNTDHSSTTANRPGTGAQWTIFAQAGNSPPTLTLSATSQSFKRAQDYTIEGADIELTVNLQNSSATITWAAVDSKGAAVTLTGSGNTRTLAKSGVAAADVNWIKVTATAGVLSDSVTVAILNDGESSFSIWLTNEAHVFPADSGGNVASGNLAAGATSLRVYRGTDEFFYDGSSPYSANTYRVAAAFTGIAMQQSAPGGRTTFTPTAVSASGGKAVFTITVQLGGGLEETFEKEYSFSTSQAGLDGLAGASAKVVKLTASKYSTSFDSLGNPSPAYANQAITLTATPQNIGGTLYYSWLKNGAVVETNTSATRVLDDSNELPPNGTTPVTWTVQVRSGAQGNPVEATDSLTIYPVMPGAQGVAGNSAKSVSLSANTLVASYNQDGVRQTSSIQLSAATQNLAGTPYYQFFVNGSSVQASTVTASYTYTPPNNYSDGADTIRVDVRDGAASGVIVAQDEVSIPRLKSGANSFTAVLSNQVHSFSSSDAGAVLTYDGSGTLIRVYEGANELQFQTGTGNPTANSSFKVSLSASGITAGALSVSGLAASVAKASGMANATLNASISFTITVLSSSGAISTLTAAQNFSKSKQGVPGNSARAVVLTPNTLVAKYSDTGVRETSSITFSAAGQNFSQTIYYRFYKDGVAQGTAATITNTYSFSPASVYTDNKVYNIKVEAREGSATGAVVAQDIVSIPAIKSGSDVLTAVLSNEAHVFPADNGGNILSSNNSGTLVRVYRGSQELQFEVGTGEPTGDGKFKITATGSNITPGAATVSGTAASFANPTAMPVDEESASITFSIRVRLDSSNSVTLTKTQTFSKSLAGKDGSSARAVVLTSPTQVSSYNANNARLTSSIGFTATPQNFSGTPYYQFFLNGTSVRASAVGNTYTFTPPTTYSDGSDTIRVDVRDGAASGVVVAQDQISIPRLKSGSDVITVVLSNSLHSFSTDKNGAVADYTGSGTLIRVYQGIDELTWESGTGNPSANNKFRVSATASGITVGAISLAGKAASVAQATGMADGTLNASISYLVSIKNSNGAVSTQTVVQNFSKSRQGETGQTGASGPGIIFRGEWTPNTIYESTALRRDVVVNAGVYYLATATHTSPAVWSTTNWTTFGAQFSSIATGLLLSDTTVTRKTIQVGTTAGARKIILDANEGGGANANPSIKIGNSGGYDSPGIFLGYDSGEAKLSLKSDDAQQFLRWTGTNLEIGGVIKATGGEFLGTISVGDGTMLIGPEAQPTAPTVLTWGGHQEFPLEFPTALPAGLTGSYSAAPNIEFDSGNPSWSSTRKIGDLVTLTAYVEPIYNNDVTVTSAKIYIVTTDNTTVTEHYVGLLGSGSYTVSTSIAFTTSNFNIKLRIKDIQLRFRPGFSTPSGYNPQLFYYELGRVDIKRYITVINKSGIFTQESSGVTMPLLTASRLLSAASISTAGNLTGSYGENPHRVVLSAGNNSTYISGTLRFEWPRLIIGDISSAAAGSRVTIKQYHDGTVAGDDSVAGGLKLIRGGANTNYWGLYVNSSNQLVASDGSSSVVLSNPATSYTAGAGIALNNSEFSIGLTTTGTGDNITDLSISADGISITKGDLPKTLANPENLTLIAVNSSGTQLGSVTYGGSSAASFTLKSGSNVTLSYGTGGIVTISSINTTYTSGTGLTLENGTKFHISNNGVTTTQLADSAVSTAKIVANAVTYGKLQNTTNGVSLLGRAVNSPGQLGEITAVTNGHYLRRSGDVLNFGEIAISDVSGLQTALNNKAAVNQTMYIGTTAVAINRASGSLTLGVNITGSAGSVPWSNVTGLPLTFPPESHTHTITNVTGLQTALDSKAAAGHTHANLTFAASNGGTQGSIYTGAGALTVSYVTVGAAASSHNHSAANITSGTLAIGVGGTGANNATSARQNLGLGDLATQNKNNVDITGGNIYGLSNLAIGHSAAPNSRGYFVKNGFNPALGAPNDDSVITLIGSPSSSNARAMIYMHVPYTSAANNFNKGASGAIAIRNYQSSGSNLPRSEIQFLTTGRNSDSSDATYVALKVNDIGDTTHSRYSLAQDHQDSSDKRIKTLIKQGSGLEFARYAQLYLFNKEGVEEPQWGLLAQDMQKADPYLVGKMPHNRLGEILTLSPLSIASVAIQGVKELEREIIKLKAEIKKLENKINGASS